MSLTELQVDRLVGPTHHFGGLGVGNVASQESAGHLSNPAAAAIQGLDKMRLIASLGVPQLILPPQSRHDFGFLRAIGFCGTDRDLLKRAYEQAPGLLSAAVSCSAMWTANAATITPAVDSAGIDSAGIDSDQSQTNVTIANLNASIHRAIEPVHTEADLRNLLSSTCRIHSAIPGGSAMRDEGAANHMRLGLGSSRPGINLFVYGDGDPNPTIHWPRQTRAACEAIARLHHLPAENTFFLKQHPDAIDAGAFHNDVVAMSHQNVLVYHELAFLEDPETFERLAERFEQLTDTPLVRVEIPDAQLSLRDAIDTYLFNSQIVSAGDSDRSTIICTNQVERNTKTRSIVDGWCNDGIFSEPRFIDLGQSMSGGGGPACLRLRVPLSSAAEIPVGAFRWSEEKDQRLRELIDREYPKTLSLEELADTDFHRHASQTVSRIEQTLEIG